MIRGGERPAPFYCLCLCGKPSIELSLLANSLVRQVIRDNHYAYSR